MVFSSLSFLFLFLPIFLICYYLIKDEYKNGLLFLGSLLFYGLGEHFYGKDLTIIGNIHDNPELIGDNGT